MSRFFISLLLLLTTVDCFPQGPWTQMAQFPGPGRHRSFGFSIGDKGYIGAGWIGTPFWSDFWEYDPASNSWTQRASLPTGGIVSPCGFSIGNKGYFTLGLDYNWNDNLNLWEYDPTLNTWVAKAPWPSWGAWGTEAFVIGTKAYVGDQGTSDMYIYDQTTDQWTYAATSFYFIGDEVVLSLNGKGYYATSQTGNQLWEYNPVTTIWSQRATMPAGGITEASGFAAGGKIYVGTGQWFATGDRLSQFWEYNPASNTWKAVDDLPGLPRDDASAFSIGNKGYLGTGTNGINLQDFWEFDPQNITSVNETSSLTDVSVSVFPNPMTDESTIQIKDQRFKGQDLIFELFDSKGQRVRQFVSSTSSFVINRDGLPAGIFFYKISVENKAAASGKLIIK